MLLALVAGVTFYERPVECYRANMYWHEFLSGASSRTVVVDGHHIHYLVEGPEKGAVVVLVHGLGGSTEDWRELAPPLAKAGFRVFMPDLLGYGRSDRPGDFSYAVHDEADFVVRFMDTMGIPQADVGGWSMGGGIAQHLAFRHPERVRRLILFDSAGIWEQPRWNVRLFTPSSSADLAELDALLMPNPPVVPEFVTRDILRVSREHAWVIRRATDSMMTGQDATDHLLPQLKMPVLIVWGTLDRIMPLSQGETMHRLVPQSEMIVAEGCGHLAPVQCSEKIVPGILSFLQH